MGGQICQPQRGLFLHHHAKHTVAGGQRSDPLAGGIVDAGVHELAEHAVLVEYAEGAIPGTDQLRCARHDVPQCGVEVKAAADPEHTFEQRIHSVTIGIDYSGDAGANLAEQPLQSVLGERTRNQGSAGGREPGGISFSGHAPWWHARELGPGILSLAPPAGSSRPSR